MTAFFLTDHRPLHQALEAAFASELQVYDNRDDLLVTLSASNDCLVILDAEYAQISGYAICEEIKAQSPAIRVHILSNEINIGIDEKASYAGVDRVFRVPKELAELLSYE